MCWIAWTSGASSLSKSKNVLKVRFSESGWEEAAGIHPAYVGLGGFSAEAEDIDLRISKVALRIGVSSGC
jgi:hypothetical protein